MAARRPLPAPMGVYDLTAPENAELCQPTGEWTFQAFRALFTGVSRASDWPIPTVKIIHKDMGRQLVYSDSPETSNSYTLVFRPTVVDALGLFLEQFGELLPLECDDGELFAYNVTNCPDVLDEEKSNPMRFSDGRIYGIDCPVFKTNAVEGQHVFMLPQSQTGSIYVSNEFIDRWKAAKLKGLRFINTADMYPFWWTKGKMKSI